VDQCSRAVYSGGCAWPEASDGSLAGGLVRHPSGFASVPIIIALAAVVGAGALDQRARPNLRRARVGDVQVRDKHMLVLPRELTGDGATRWWNGVVLARAPGVARCARRAGRTIPVAVLKPAGGTRQSR
jgi:hypothetical protein